MASFIYLFHYLFFLFVLFSRLIEKKNLYNTHVYIAREGGGGGWKEDIINR